MKKPTPFSLTYVTCDINRKVGGEILKLNVCLLPMHKKAAGAFAFEMPEEPKTDFSKNPHHYESATRNVILPNGKIKKFHIRLLLEFNGSKVFY